MIEHILAVNPGVKDYNTFIAHLICDKNTQFIRCNDIVLVNNINDIMHYCEELYLNYHSAIVLVDINGIGINWYEGICKVVNDKIKVIPIQPTKSDYIYSQSDVKEYLDTINIGLTYLENK